jgi:hypothetical protein
MRFPGMPRYSRAVDIDRVATEKTDMDLDGKYGRPGW